MENIAYEDLKLFGDVKHFSKVKKQRKIISFRETDETVK